MKFQSTPIAAILSAVVTLLVLSPSADAASVAGAGIEVDGKYVGGYAITWSKESREDLVRQLSRRPITFERDYKVPVDAKDAKVASLQGRIRLLSRIRGDRTVMTTVESLKLVKRGGEWFVEPDSLKRALKPAAKNITKDPKAGNGGAEPPAAAGGAKSEERKDAKLGSKGRPE